MLYIDEYSSVNIRKKEVVVMKRIGIMLGILICAPVFPRSRALEGTLGGAAGGALIGGLAGGGRGAGYGALAGGMFGLFFGVSADAENRAYYYDDYDNDFDDDEYYNEGYVYYNQPNVAYPPNIRAGKRRRSSAQNNRNGRNVRRRMY